VGNFKFSRKPSKLMLSTIAASAAAISPALLAQVEAEGQGVDRRLEEVVVTAQRRAQSLTDVPQTVQAWSDEMLKQSGLENIDDIINVIPSASQTAAIAGGSTSYQMRGVAASETDGDATVGFYLDNFAYSMPGRPYAPVADFYDMERVEVLRGPSGTLYGLGSIGGTIKVITRDPDLDVVEGAIRLTGSTTAGGEEGWSGDVMFNTPLVPGKLAVRGVLTHKDIGGYADIIPTGAKNANDAKSTTGRFKVLATPTEDLRMMLTYWHNDSSQDFQDRVTFAKPPALEFSEGKSPSEYKIISVDVEYDLGFATLASTTGHLKNEVHNRAVGFIPGVGTFAADFPLMTESFSEDLRLTSNSDGPFTWIAGIFYQDSETKGGQDAYLPDVATPENMGIRTVNRNNKIESKSYAIYGEGTYSFKDGFVDLTLGGRFFREKRKFIENSTLELLELGTVIPTIGTTNSDKDTFNPRANLSWHPTENGTVYVEVAKGFRSGAITSNAIMNSANLILGTNFSSSSSPDTLWNYQAGMKWQLLDNSLQVELAAYHFDWEDAQIELSPTSQSIVAPIGDVRGRGIDMQIDWNTPLRGLALTLSGNVNDTELKDVVNGVSAALPWLSNGSQLPGTAEKTLALSTNYTRPLADTGLDVTLYGRYTYRSKQQSVFDGRYVPSTELMTLRASLSNADYEVALFIDNVTDEDNPISAPGGQFVVPYPQTFGISFERFF